MACVAGAAVAAALSACGDDPSASIRGGGGVVRTAEPQPVDAAQLAKSLFDGLYADLDKTCGGHCHGTGESGGNPPLWLAGPDPYRTVKTYPGMVLADPSTSKILTKGVHAGPALEGPNQALGDKVTKWLKAEALAMVVAELPATEPFPIALGQNTIDLGVAFKDVPGTKLTFKAQVTGNILTLSNLTVVAPASTGVHVVHPLFITVSGDGKRTKDAVDSFSNVDEKVAQGASAPLGPGELLLVNWAADDKLAVAMTKIETATVTAADAGSTGGCKSVALFTANAAPALQNNQCAGCHGGQNAGATAALDLTALGKDDAAACGQALSKVTLADKPKSPILQAPAGGVANHPFQIGDANALGAYVNAMNKWITAE